MFDEFDNVFTDEHLRRFLQGIVGSGRAGLFAWHMDKNKFDVVETFTGKKFKHIQTLEEFIRQIVFPKDVELALQDLELFMNGVSQNYESTFRVVDSQGYVKWLLVKGSLMDDNKMTGIMYDVTSRNMKLGHDIKTNLMNNETLMRKLRNSICNAEKKDELGALLNIDIANYHNIINRYGNDFGDSILYNFSRVLLEFIGPYDEVARFPYNKFMLLLNRIYSIQEVEQIAQAVASVFEEPMLINGELIYLDIKMGVTTYPDMSSDVNELIRFSDFTIDHALKNENNAFIVFDEKLKSIYNRELDIENKLPTAIYNKELSLVYQPQLDLKSNKIIGFEALVRWTNKRTGVVPPNEFIPIAEDKGYIISIGQWVREESIKTARRWLDLGFDFKKISMNISTIELAQKNFKKKLLYLCEQYNVDPSLVELEITERAFLVTEEGQSTIVDDLLAEGFKIAIDDFGTGYSNLHSLVVHRIDTLKLDKSLIDNIHDPRQQHIIKGILQAKNHLYSEIVAEGVENKETLNTLSELDFDTIQGYYFSRPLTRDAMEDFVLKYKEKSK